MSTCSLRRVSDTCSSRVSTSFSTRMRSFGTVRFSATTSSSWSTTSCSSSEIAGPSVAAPTLASVIGSRSSRTSSRRTGTVWVTSSSTTYLRRLTRPISGLDVLLDADALLRDRALLRHDLLLVEHDLVLLVGDRGALGGRADVGVGDRLALEPDLLAPHRHGLGDLVLDDVLAQAHAPDLGSRRPSRRGCAPSGPCASPPRPPPRGARPRAPRRRSRGPRWPRRRWRR